VTKSDKLIQKIFARQQVSYKEAEKILFELGYELKVSGSHHVFRKAGYKHITIKRRPQLLPYQLTDLQEVLRDHGIKEKI
jgi:predicted RNA binding protein YcfA (HicA-like mRNA interferase family)